MGFGQFKQKDEAGNKEANNWAFVLRSTLIDKRLLSKSSLLKGIRELKKLRTRETAAKVTTVVNWYCQNAGRTYVPLARTVEQFCTKFADIERAMQRSGNGEETSISFESEALAMTLGEQYQWPVEIAAALPAIVQRTRDNWEKAWQAMVKYAWDSPSDSKAVAFLATVHEKSSNFLLEWFKVLHIREGWKGHYTGAVMSLAFNSNSGDMMFLESFWRLWSKEWCGKPSAFDDLYYKIFEKKVLI